jgi:hypothetical protein
VFVGYFGQMTQSEKDQVFALQGLTPIASTKRVLPGAISPLENAEGNWW